MKKQIWKNKLVAKNGGSVIWKQDESSGKAENRQAMTGKEKQMAEAKECTGEIINKDQLRELTK